MSTVGVIHAEPHDAGVAYNPDVLNITIASGTTSIEPTDRYHSLWLLTWQDYTRLKELQYINAIKAVVAIPDSDFIVSSTEIRRGSNKYQVIRERVIWQIINYDALGFFSDSPVIRKNLASQFNVGISTP